MKLASTADSLNKIANLGSTELPSRRLFIYQQCNCKIIEIQRPSSGNNGKLILQGDADSTSDGLLTNADVIWLTTRPLNYVHEVTLDVQPSYSSINKVTTVTIPTTANFKVDSLDVGGYVCKKIDITDRIVDKSIGNISFKLEDGFANSGSSEFSVSLNNIDGYFYDRENKDGLFYGTPKYTAVSSVASTSTYASLYGLYTTLVTVGAIDASKVGVDYIGHYMLFNSGKAIGHQALIIDFSSGTTFEVLGYFSDNFIDPVKYQTEIAANDSIYLNISYDYWFRYEFGLLSELDERKNLICGKLDFSAISFDEFDQIVQIKGYTLEREFDKKVIADIPFTSSGIKCTKLTEINCVYYESATGSLLHGGVNKIERKLSTEEAEFINITFAAYDVMPGWHWIDVIPNLGLYRFGYGKWYRVRSSFDFEYSTNNVFLPNENGIIPDHTSKDGADETERHLGWIQVGFETADSSSVGMSSQTYSGMDAGLALNPEKITGLPNKSMRLFFKLSEGVALNKKQEFIGRVGYSFDGGSVVYPEIYPAMVLEGTAINTVAANRNITMTDKTDNIWSDTDDVLMIGGFEKFDGLHFNVVFQASGGIVTELLQHLKLSYSIGGNIDTAASWSNNVYPRYCGTIVHTVNSQTELKNHIYYWDRPGGGGTGGADAMSADELNGMYLKSVSGANFGTIREITDFSVDGDKYGIITIASEFDTNVGVNDQFEVVNKSAVVKIKDFGDGLHNGGYFDCILLESVNHGDGGVALNIDKRVDFYEDYLSSEDTGRLEHKGALYLGKIDKFSNINIMFEQTDSNLSVPMIVEYYNGNSWVPVENLSVYDVDTTDSDYISEPYAEDNLHYLISYSCQGWTKTTITSTETVINEGVNLYFIRIRTNIHYVRNVVRVEPVEPSNLGAVIIWNNLKEWSRNVYTDTECYDMGTLNKIQQEIEYYFVKLELDGNWKNVNRVYLINRLYSHSSDSLYAYFDMLNLKDVEDVDYIAYNKDAKINANVIPRISTDKYIIDNLSEAVGLSKRLSITKNYLKNKIDINSKHLNIIGDFVNTVKILPVKFNWDSAQLFYNNAYEDNGFSDIICTCVIKDKGLFRLFVLKNVGDGTVFMYTSTTGEPGDWGAADADTIVKTTDAFTLDAIKWISVVKNRDSAIYHLYLVGTQDGKDEIYEIEWSTWGTFTANNTAIIELGAEDADDDTAIIDCCALWDGTDDPFTKYREIWYTGYNGANRHIMWASGANVLSKQGTVVSQGDFDESANGVRCPCVVTSKLTSTDTDSMRIIFFICKDVSNDERLAVIRYGENAVKDVPAISTFDDVIAYKSINYCYEGHDNKMVTFSYDFARFYYSTSGSLFTLSSIDLTNFNQDKLSAEYKEEFGEFDKFISDSVDINFDDGNQVLLLGFREKFNTVDLKEVTASDEYLEVQYWNGTDWTDLKVYQYGVLSEQVKNKMGFYFDEPVDWQPIDMAYLIDNQKINGTGNYLKRETASMYWIKLVGDGNVSTIHLNSAKMIKGAYVIADKNDVWLLKDDGFLEHKLCASRLYASSIYRKEIVDISFDEIHNNVSVVIYTNEFNPYARESVEDYSDYAIYFVNIFDKTGKISDFGQVPNSKDCRYVYRSGTDILNDNSKYAYVIGRWSDAYIDAFDNP